MTALETVYKHHHSTGNRYGTVHLRAVRSSFLHDKIGVGKEVLDIGVRDGELAKYYMAGNKVDGVDIDSDALKVAETLGIHTMHFDLGEAWPITKKYDVVVAGEVMEHLFFPDVITAKVASVLRPDGMFIGTVPNAFNLRRRVALMLLNKAPTSLADPTHINHFTVRELREMLGVHFKHVEIFGHGRLPFSNTFPQALAFDLFFIAKYPRS